jgi:hypothetical protein
MEKEEETVHLYVSGFSTSQQLSCVLFSSEGIQKIILCIRVLKRVARQRFRKC